MNPMTIPMMVGILGVVIVGFGVAIVRLIKISDKQEDDE